MSEQNDKFKEIIEKDAEEKRLKQAAHKEMPFIEYIKLLETDPLIAQNSPSRLWEIIKNAGIVEIPEDEQWLGVDVGYELFRSELFGVDKPASQFVEHIKIGAAKGSTGKQIVVLVGPPAAGKSTAVTTVVDALQAYNTRPVFRIKGCPKHEEPLHLLPRHMRAMAAIKTEDCPECSKDPDHPKHIHLGIKIEGDLCPVCRHLLLTEYKKSGGTPRWSEVPVETFTFSKQSRRGIGSFEPSDEKSADVSKLTGKENFAITGAKGHDHPLAFSLGGEIPVGERGIVEGREILSSDPSTLRVFFSVAEEKELKVEGSFFPHISVDTLVIGHTNLNVYKKFSKNKEYEGLHDRFLVVKWPYPIRIRDEVKLYRKLIERDSEFQRIQKCHIAPGTLEMAALFAILTRLRPSQMGVDVLTKAKIYNGDRSLTDIVEKDKKPIDVRELLDEGQMSDDIAEKEGMFGVSSRTVLAAINSALSKEGGSNGCLTPAKALRALRDGFDQRMGFAPEDVKRFREFLTSGEGGSVLVEYRNFIVSSVTKAFLKRFEPLAVQIFDSYVQEALFDQSLNSKYVTGITTIKRDNLSGKPKEPNYKLLRSIEEQIPIAESEATRYRSEILLFKLGQPGFGYHTYPPLARAVEKKLMSDSKATLKLVLATDKPLSDEEKSKANELFQELTRAGGPGFCHKCAKEALDDAAKFLNE